MGQNKIAEKMDLSCEWVDREFKDELDNIARVAVGCAMQNIANQVGVVCYCDGDLTAFLSPVYWDRKSDDFIKVDADSECVLISFNMLDALKAEVETWLREGRPSKHEIMPDEWPDRRKELLALSDQIRELADKLA